MATDWMFDADGTVCALRVAGVWMKEGSVLLQRDRDGSDYALPGGHVKAGEPMAISLAREFHEELGIEIEIKRLLWSEEGLWTWQDKRRHSIAFYYLIEAAEAFECPDGGVPQKDNPNVVFEWMPVESLKSVCVYPEFLAREIGNLNSPMKHFTDVE